MNAQLLIVAITGTNAVSLAVITAMRMLLSLGYL
jgi:hypothetical protein